MMSCSRLWLTNFGYLASGGHVTRAAHTKAQAMSCGATGSCPFPTLHPMNDAGLVSRFGIYVASKTGSVSRALFFCLQEQAQVSRMARTAMSRHGCVRMPQVLIWFRGTNAGAAKMLRNVLANCLGGPPSGVTPTPFEAAWCPHHDVHGICVELEVYLLNAARNTRLKSCGLVFKAYGFGFEAQGFVSFELSFSMPGIGFHGPQNRTCNFWKTPLSRANEI